MLLSIQHCNEQNCFQFSLENSQADVRVPHLRRQCVPASGAGHCKCPRTNCLCATHWYNQFTRCCRSKVWPGGNARNRNTAPGQVSRSRSIQTSEIHDAVVCYQFLLVHRASEVDCSCRQLSDRTFDFCRMSRAHARMTRSSWYNSAFDAPPSSPFTIIDSGQNQRPDQSMTQINREGSSDRPQLSQMIVAHSG